MKTKALDVSTGKIIDIEDPDEVINDEENFMALRARRNEMLAGSDWIVIREREEGGTVKNFADWKEYRQKLRDITSTYKSLKDVKWPNAPSE